MYNQVLQVVMHLTFTYCGKPSAFPVNSLKTEVGRDAAIEDWGKNLIEFISLGGHLKDAQWH